MAKAHIRGFKELGPICFSLPQFLFMLLSVIAIQVKKFRKDKIKDQVEVKRGFSDFNNVV